MRAPPPVAVRCGGGGAWRVAQALLPALAAAAVSAWACLHLDQGNAVALAAALAAAAGVGALAWRLAALRAAQLAWDGRQWQADGQPGRLSVMLDLGPFLLLRHHGAAGRRWLAASAAEAGPAWHGLRAAAYARLPAAD